MIIGAKIVSAFPVLKKAIFFLTDAHPEEEGVSEI